MIKKLIAKIIFIFFLRRIFFYTREKERVRERERGKGKIQINKNKDIKKSSNHDPQTIPRIKFLN